MARKIILKQDGLTGSGNAPDGYKYLGDNAGDISEKVGATVSAIGGSNYESITHAQLITLISTNGLTEGNFYLISDYKTVYIQPDFSDRITPVPVSGTLIKEGVTEPLVVVATSNNTIGDQVWSTTFPDDIIYYDHAVETLYTGYFTKGKITRRIDKAGNDISFDFRNVKFKRYPSLVYNGYQYYNNGEASVEVYVFPSRNLQLNTYQSVDMNNKIEYRYSLELDTYDAAQYGIWGFNTVIYGDSATLDNVLSGFITNNDIVADTVYGNEFVGGIMNSHFGAGLVLGGNKFISSYKTQLIDINSTQVGGNIIQGGLYDTSIISSNTIRNNILSVNTGGVSINSTTFDGNNINCRSIQRFSFGSGVFRDNSINCSTLGHTTNGLTASISTNFYGNTITNNLTNFTLNQFYNNKIYDSISGITAYTFAHNYVDRSMSSVTFNTGSTYSVTYNRFGTNINSTNFTSSTHVYGAYQCDIFFNSDGVARLRYVDGSDATVTVNITD